MYCRKCGAQIDDNSTFCHKCGTQVPNDSQAQSNFGTKTNESAVVSSAKNSNSKVAMVVVFILSIVVAISPFVKMYYIDFFEQEDFSVSGILDTASEILDFGSDMGGEFHISDIKFDEMSNEAKVVLFVVIFDMIMFIIGFGELLAELVYLVSGKSDSEGKFWKASISSLIAFFIANLIIWAALMLINASLSDELDSSVKLFGAHASHYIIQIFAIVTYIIAHSKYRAWKKENN